MASKDPVEALNSYVTDMLALEQHIKKAIDGQIEDLKSYPAVTSELRSINGRPVQCKIALNHLVGRLGR